MDTDTLIEKLEDLLKDAEEGFTYREILNTAAISEYAHEDVRHVLGAIAYRQQSTQRWRLKTIKLPVTRNVVRKVEKSLRATNPVESKKPPAIKRVVTDEARILAFLKKHPEGVTSIQIADELNMQKPVAAHKIQALVAAGKIVRHPFKIRLYGARNQSTLLFLAEYKDYALMHLHLVAQKDQAAKLGFTVTMKLEGFPEVKF